MELIHDKMVQTSFIFIWFTPIDLQYIQQVEKMLKNYYENCKLHTSRQISLLFDYENILKIPMIHEKIGKIIARVENPDEISFKIHEII